MNKYFFKGHTASIINHSFQTMLVLYLVLLLLEQIKTGFVSNYLNLNYLLVIVIILGILDVFSEHNFIVKKPNKFDYGFIVALGILGFGIIKYKTIELGFLSWIISIIAGILIILLSFLILSEDEKESKRENKTSAYDNFKKHNKNTYYALLIAVPIFVLLLISIILNFFTSLSFFESLRIVFGSVFVLFLPGLIISYIFFPKTKSFDSDKTNDEKDGKSQGIDWIERIALSFALSISVIPLVVFYLNLVGVKINTLNVFFIVLGVMLISAVILVIIRMRKR